MFNILSFLFLMTDLFPLHILALVGLLKTLNPGSKELIPSVFEVFFVGVLLVLMIFQMTLNNSINYSGIEKLLKESGLIISIISFLVFIPLLKLISLLKDTASKMDLIERVASVWVWIGIYNSYVFKLTIDINLHKYVETKLLSVVLCLIVIIMIISSFKVEKETDNLRKIWMLIVFNLALSSINLFANFSTPVTLFWANNLLILAFISVNNIQDKPSFSLALSSLALITFFITIPFSPWFNFKYGLMAYYLVGKDIPMASVFLILLGLNFRQSLMLVPILSRQVYSRKPKPS
tara:strand:+ start:380948 stop:381826 length:879 start_codon:yes stop_codon:yes gene_type:complete